MGEGKKVEEGGGRSISLKDIEEAIKKIVPSEEDLRPYKILDKGLYQLPGNIITGKRGLEQYLKELKKC
jgi:hypothetical protein